MNQSNLLQILRESFHSTYRKEPLVFAAPGRVNLIGEHTDYNEGYVLPGAVDKRIYVAIAKNDASQVNVFARSLGEHCSFSLNDRSPRTGWINYLMGVHSFFRDRWDEGEGLDVVIDGDIPIGAGMSSSAALCTAFAYALRSVFQTEHSLWDIAFLSQKAEHEFAGVRCGIMDQFACLHGKKDFVMQLDCRSLEYSYIPFDFPGHCIVLVNTGITHSLASGEYNIRRGQCEEGVRLLQQTYSSIRSLRDVTIDMLVTHREEMPELIWKRCMYVAEENDRLLRGCAYLRQKDLDAFGKCMYASHLGLRLQYAVSCPELDFLVAEASGIKGVSGARMMGGGFGGCTINIVERSCQDLFMEHIAGHFSQRFGSEPSMYVMQLEDGVRQVL